MAVGSDAKPILPGYIALGRESTWGTYASATSAVEAISCSFKTEIDSEKLDAIGNRGFHKRVTLSKTVAGELETYFHPVESVPLIAAALGGAVVSNSVTAGVYDHSISAGNMDTSTCFLGLSFNVRKGNAHVWRYNGGRVNSMKISAAVGEAVKVTWEMIFKDSTMQSDDIASILSVSSLLPMTFADGVFRYSDTEANAATTTVQEPIQGFELSVKNNLASEESARELGTRILSVLPPTRREVELTITQRFDTTTAYNRFIQATQGSVELFFRSGNSLGNNCFPEITIRLPKVFQNSNDPMLDDSSGILSAEFTYDAVVDNPSTTTGKDIGVTVRNAVVSY
jgi:hypothetical protein